MTIIQWNCRGYRSNYGDLINLIKYCSPECVCLQETILGDRIPHPPRGYFIYCFSPTNHPAPGNGLTLLVSNASSYLQVPLTTTLQAQAFVIGLRKSFTICNIYISPNDDLSYYDIESLINQLPTPFILARGVNAKHPMWGSDNWSARESICSSSGEPWHFADEQWCKDPPSCKTNTLSAIDITICSSDLQAELVWDVDGDLRGSDHYPIIHGNITKHAVIRQKQYIIYKANWTLFRGLTII